MENRIRHFITPTFYKKCKSELQGKILDARINVFYSLNDIIDLNLEEIDVDSCANLYSALIRLNNFTVNLENFESAYVRSRKHYFELKNASLLRKEELDLYDSEFCEFEQE